MDVEVLNEIYDWMIVRMDEHVCLAVFDHFLNEDDGFVRDNLNEGVDNEIGKI